MHHDWIFDVLTDLHDYASRNDLPALARHVEEALAVARREIGGEAAGSPGKADRPPPRRAH